MRPNSAVGPLHRAKGKRMSKKRWILLALLAGVFAVMTVYGVWRDDVEIVLKNAANICFS